jgi:uncharacterized phage-associated protein
MPYDAIAIANYFLDLAKERGQSLTPMKVQKLVYFAHGWHLAIKGTPLIDEQVEAWSYGPVIRSLYREFREYGDRAITEKGFLFKARTKTDGTVSYQVVRPDIADDPKAAPFTKQLLDKIWRVYGPHTAIQLANMTHEPGTPWRLVQEAYTGTPLPKGTDIPAESIRSYFRGLARSGAKAS